MEKPRKVVAIFEVDDAQAEKLGFGTIDYFETCLGTMCTSGIKEIDSRILDNDDPEDTAAIKAVNEIFNY